MEQTRSETSGASILDLFSSLKAIILGLIVFAFPLFFLTTTQEFFVTNKMYLLAFGAIALMVVSTVEFALTKKLSWRKSAFDNIVIFFLVTIGLSIIIESPNKIQALLSPTFGLVMVAALAVLYFYLSRQKYARDFGRNVLRLSPINLLLVSSTVLSLVSIISFFQPFKNAKLPEILSFLKNPAFTPMGTQLDLVLFVGFVIVYLLVSIVFNQKANEENSANEARSSRSILFGVLLLINLTAVLLTLYSVFKPAAAGQQAGFVLPPFRLSWYAAVETLKNPITALFGIGIDNFSAIYTQVKDVAYNQSSMWTVPSFVVARSTFLHIFSEAGLFGVLAFIILFVSLFKRANRPVNTLSTTGITYSANAVMVLYMLAVMIFFPPSLVVFFLFFVLLSEIAREHLTLRTEEARPRVLDLNVIIPVYIALLIVFVGAIVTMSYLLGRTYLAEIYFKKSLDAFITNSAKTLYDNQRQAIVLDPYIERFRINFSQTNLLIANNIAAQAIQQGGKNPQISEQDRQTIAQAIQASIAEAKAAVALNPQKASNWENLAVIYRNVLAVAQGADVWTVSSYQRSILLDPQNPAYRLNLGGVYYSLGAYQDAAQLFQQAVNLKPDWSNAYYNLAWTYYQLQNYQQAVLVMQNVQALLDPNKDAADYKKVQTELEEFRKKLPETTQQTQTTTGNQQQTLSLPTLPATTISPKIQLPNPKAASPEAVTNR